MMYLTHKWALAAGLTFVALPVAAQEICIACQGPDALYRCTLGETKPGAASALPAFCANALAKSGPHATCAIKRGVTVFECDAPVKRVGVDPATGELALIAPPPPPKADPNAPPKTVAEALQRAKAASDQNAKTAGANSKSFFEKSLACVGSLFTKCEKP